MHLSVLTDQQARFLRDEKEALAGFRLDIMIRDASNNVRSLDTVMREVYQSGRGHDADGGRTAEGRRGLGVSRGRRRTGFSPVSARIDESRPSARSRHSLSGCVSRSAR